jgi:hypothetical protein
MGKEFFAVPGMPEAYLKEIPLRRLGTPEDFADAVVWLSGPAYVTGLNLQVNGGNQLGRFPHLDEMPGGVESAAKGKPIGDRYGALRP